MKTINSEVKIDSSLFTLKIGTTDKKNPKVVYIDGGAYISPSDATEPFSNFIENIKLEVKTGLTKMIKTKKDFGDNIMFILDVADARIERNKKSHLSFQIYLRLSNEIGSFNNVVDFYKKNYNNEITTLLANKISKNGFVLTKTKR